MARSQPPKSPRQIREEQERQELAAQQQRKKEAKEPGDLNHWRDLANERIEEAMSNGAFENLPGRGKPLNLNPNPNEPPDMAMANKILKNNDLSPGWINDRKKLLEEIETLRADMRREWAWVQAAYGDPSADREALERGWARSLAAWQERMDDLNRRILDLNLTMPIWRMELLRLRMDDELERLHAPRSLSRAAS